MQMQLPIFPESTKLINACLGFYEMDDFVYYLHNGSPIFCHDKNDINSYRYITANLVESHLCTPKELSDALGVNSRNIQRYSQNLRKFGADYFFQKKERKGDAHKLTQSLLDKTQSMLDQQIPVARIAKEVGVTEGAIRYQIKKGSLKKKHLNKPREF